MNMQHRGRLLQGAPVKEYGSAEDMRAHAKAVKARLMSAAPLRPVVVVEEPSAVTEGPTIEDVREALRPDVPNPRAMVFRPREIMRAVAEHHRVTVAELKSERRTARIVTPRQLAMLAVWIECPVQTLPSIGRLFGGRDHTTVLHAIRKFTDGKVRAWPAELFWLRDLVAVPPASNEEGCA
ncbi:hypothetical protein ASF58_23355 [Methylobacterium sp. Leaf125]|uniref:helix-turn-helix domain-containing protein n=1 Tax=Methylobacterium sp. Leaf125 TaxID=1736265 RepID=UPI0006F750F8|nr:helix-turn-helix domain-containing protein [Methylobacterium sp. Leaf125]KQQ39081.1 hypothetical protein ASF58_23355 [Methylobacterium sp. Leaf125]